MKELDVLLSRYARERFLGATATQRAAFEALLQLPDPQIADYLLGHAIPADPALAELLPTLSARL